MGSNWWIRFGFVTFLVLMSVRALVPTFAFRKETFADGYLARFQVEFKKDSEGKVVKGDDGKPVILYETHKTGKKKGEMIRDENGQPIPVFARTKEGLCQPEYGKDGKMLFVEVPALDANNKPLKNSKGEPVMTKTPLTDAVWERCYLPNWYTTFFPYKRLINLGLDLQGGTHLVLSVDVRKAIINKTMRLSDDIVKFLKEKKLITEDNQIFHDPNEIHVDITLKTDALATQARNEIEKMWDYLRTTPQSKAHTYRVSFSDDYIQKAREAAVAQAIDTIRGRVDALGVSEPSISKYGDTDIAIQLPGLKDPRRAKELIGKTALLAFHVVEDEADGQKIHDQLSKSLPKGINAETTSYERPKGAMPGTDRYFWSEDKRLITEWVKEWNRKLLKEFPNYQVFLGPYEIEGRDKKERPVRTFLLHRKAALTGGDLEEARPQVDTQMNRPEVGLTFNRVGADLFEQMTGKYIGRRFAIVLEERVDSAPVIQDRIGGGRARITLGGMKSYEESMQDAKDLSFVLKSGSLPAPVEILYEKTVGPALGADSIQRGVNSLLYGFIAVLLFMLIYYRGSGFAANIALLLNIFFVMALMASFGATLTLPGMAGILLTIGMAVDANILIFERIREELVVGKTVRVAVQNGYEKALSTILDANITTAIAGIVLYQYGSGPIRGFAVTLLIGILCSVFTAIVVTRLIFDLFVSKKTTQTLSI